MATLLRTDGTSEEITPNDGRKFQLKEMQGLVGGWIEIVRLADRRLLIVNEEGKFNGLSLNAEATRLFQENRAWYDPIVGDALLCTKAEVD